MELNKFLHNFQSLQSSFYGMVLICYVQNVV